MDTEYLVKPEACIAKPPQAKSDVQEHNDPDHDSRSSLHSQLNRAAAARGKVEPPRGNAGGLALRWAGPRAERHRKAFRRRWCRKVSPLYRYWYRGNTKDIYRTVLSRCGYLLPFRRIRRD